MQARIGLSKSARLPRDEQDGPGGVAEGTDLGRWEMNPETGIARRTEELASTELDTCAPCHCRRKVIAKNPTPPILVSRG